MERADFFEAYNKKLVNISNLNSSHEIIFVAFNEEKSWIGMLVSKKTVFFRLSF